MRCLKFYFLYFLLPFSIYADRKGGRHHSHHPFAPFVYAYYPIYFGFVSCNFFMFEGFIWFVFLSCSHKGFLTKFIKHLKDMNFLREDLVFSTHSEEVLLTFFLFSSVLLYLACFLLNQVFFYARGHTHFVYC